MYVPNDKLPSITNSIITSITPGQPPKSGSPSMGNCQVGGNKGRQFGRSIAHLIISRPATYPLIDMFRTDHFRELRFPEKWPGPPGGPCERHRQRTPEGIPNDKLPSIPSLITRETCGIVRWGTVYRNLQLQRGGSLCKTGPPVFGRRYIYIQLSSVKFLLIENLYFSILCHSHAFHNRNSDAFWTSLHSGLHQSRNSIVTNLFYNSQRAICYI